MVPPVLLNEIADESSRGTITTLHQVRINIALIIGVIFDIYCFFKLVLTFAIFIASIIAYGLVTYVDHGWQYVQVSGSLLYVQVHGSLLSW